MAARDAIYTRILANNPVPSARVNLSMFNSDQASWTDPAPDFATPGNCTWWKPQIDSVPVFSQPWVGEAAPMYRRGLFTAEWYFLAGTGETDFDTPINALNTALHRQSFNGVEFDDFQEPDVLGLTDDDKWFRVDSSAGFVVQQSSTESLIVNQYISVLSNPVSHGFAVENVVGFNDSTGQWQKIVATTAGVANISQIGFTYFVPSVNDFMIALPGSIVSLPGNSFGTGALYLSQSTAGAVTTTVPTSGVSWKVGSSIDASRVAVKETEPQSL